LGIPILELVDTTDFQSRTQIATLFQKADIITPRSIPERTDVRELCRDEQELKKCNPFSERVVVRYGFSQNEASVAHFDATERLFKDSVYVVSVFKKGGCCAIEIKASDFLSMIVPELVLTFLSVSVFLSGDKRLEILGIFHRLHHAPFRFAGAVMPEYCVDDLELVGHAISKWENR
jgi:hypothetical protein